MNKRPDVELTIESTVATERRLKPESVIQGGEHNRLAFLDALRFFAAGAVLLQHIAEIQGQLGVRIAGSLSPGVAGVVLFFLVSGFVIPLAAGRTFDPAQFVVKRVFRIYPLVLASFALQAVLAILLPWQSFSDVRDATTFDWIANLLLIQEYVGAKTLLGVTWTLHLEVAWYAVFLLAFVVWGPSFHRRLAWVAPICLITLALLSLVADQRLPLARVGMIYAALLGCRMFNFYRGEIKLSNMLWEGMIFIAVMWFCNMISFGYFRHPNMTLNQVAIPWLLAPTLFACVVMIPAIKDSRVLNNRVVGWLGAVSFSTYLLHPIAMRFAGEYWHGVPYIIVTLALTVFMSALGYYLVEIPGQRVGRRIAHMMAKASSRGSRSASP